MTLQRHIFDLPFGVAGQEQRIDPKVVESPQLSELINGEIVEPGRITKRTGYQFIEASPGGSHTRGNGIRVNRAGQLAMLGTKGAAEWNGVIADWTACASGLVANSGCKILDVAKYFDYERLDTAYDGTYLYIACIRRPTTGSNSVMVIIVDPTTLQVLTVYGINADLTNETLGYKFIVLPDGLVEGQKRVYLLYITGSTTKSLKGRMITMWTGESAEITYIDGIVNATYPRFDVCYDSTNAYYACNIDDGGLLKTRVTKVTSSADPLVPVLLSVTYDAALAESQVCITRHDTLSQLMLVVAKDSTGVSWRLFNSSTLATLYSSAAPISAGLSYYVITAGSMSATKWLVEISGSTDILKFWTISSAGVEEDIATCYYTYPLTKPNRALDTRGPVFITQAGTGTAGYNSVYNAIQLFEDSDWPSLPIPIARFGYSMTTGQGVAKAENYCPNSLITVGSKLLFSCAIGVDVKDNNPVSTDTRKALAVGWLETDITKINQTVAHGDKVYAAAGLPYEYDGNQLRAIGFDLPPVIKSCTEDGSGTFPAGNYNYICIYEITDRFGNVYKSQCSAPFTATSSGAASHFDLTAAGIALKCDRGSNYKPTLALYRTTVGPGTIYYRVDSRSPSSVSLAWFNQKVTFADATTDATLITHETLYTTGNALERCAPPSSEVIELYQERLWVVDVETGDICYSGVLIPGEGPWFNPVQVVESGSITNKPLALVAMSQGLAVLWADKIGVIYGDGPDSLGNNSTYTSPVIIENGIGLTDLRSVVKIPGGFIFKSDKGFYLFDGQTPQYIGGGVYDYNSYTVASAVHVADKHQARFVVYNGSTMKLVLVYDYEFNQWGVWANYSTDHVHSLGGSTAYGGCVIGNTHYISADNGNTLKQGTAYYDETAPSTDTYYPLVITTPWIKLAGLQGFQRIWRAYLLGEYKSAHSLTVSIDYNYTTEETDTLTYSAVDIASKYAKLYQIPIFPKKQLCEAIRFRLVFATTSGIEGAAVNGLRLEYGAKLRPRMPHYAAV